MGGVCARRGTNNGSVLIVRAHRECDLRPKKSPELSKDDLLDRL